MNNLDKQYTELLQDILDNGVTKQDRTGTGTISVFGRQIRHDMKDGFPLLTTKKMPFKTIVTELLWFLRGDTNIKFLVDNNCHIWDGDAYKNYLKNWKPQPVVENELHWMEQKLVNDRPLPKDMFIHCIKTDDEFAKKWGELGPIYGKQWRNWSVLPDKYGAYNRNPIDQIQNLINELKTNPDSRRLMVNAWAVHDLPNMVLPPCHYGFQVYTRELSDEEIQEWWKNWRIECDKEQQKKEDKAREITNGVSYPSYTHAEGTINPDICPKRAISLMWNQRSVDTFLGLPFNIASYGLLLEIIAEIVNMVPDQLIGNLGDTHLYSNHIEQAKEQIGRYLTDEELYEQTPLLKKIRDVKVHEVICQNYEAAAKARQDEKDLLATLKVHTRQPYSLPKLRINTEFWNPGTEGGCGMGPGTYTKDIGALIEGMEVNDFQIEDYQSHPTIKAPLSN